ncbi:MAG: hypothetical protein H6Q58_1915 [Firmicutes bacterium]|nr:hypothetical protein [Bacillota bacterium]
MKRIIAVLLTLAVLVLAGCSSGGAIDESFRDRVEPVTDNILLSIKNRDREALIRDMDEKMKAAFTEEAFRIRQGRGLCCGKGCDERKGRKTIRIGSFLRLAKFEKIG